ncbi:n-acetylglucosamine-6-phosphate deacetylase [Capsaspora owczarzaki ATCC 30864]|uniref:N-acetylglucosamine-6-phosphate deacetylase n=1 Tax=Capsaspora owczarzaki (strain ATCC 30864) TaxID=595528 RepID=A0A0D2UE48_CAPO3|nr:n-acetylglucosamine-6-phosphate deacetylase [Capsaspora owczarzaki ATCC 30864]
MSKRTVFPAQGSSDGATATSDNRSRSASSQVFRLIGERSHFETTGGSGAVDAVAEQLDNAHIDHRPSHHYLDAIPPSVWFSDAVIQFYNCRLVRDQKLVHEDIYVQHGKIILPQAWFFDVRKPSDIRIDCHGMILAPGFIDVQINGAYGVDFSSCTAQEIGPGLAKVAKGLTRHGVTAFCPTFITSEPKTYHELLPLCTRQKGTATTGAEILGAHVEGPFISHQKYGAHPPEFIRSIGGGMADVLETYGSASMGNISMVTLAPELDGALDAIPALVERGIIVSLGHSSADIAKGEAAVAKGASMITHLFNAMVPFHHRDPGLVGLLATRQRQVHYGLIVDGMHTHPAAVAIAYRTNRPSCVLVTDAIAAMGLPPGEYHLGAMRVQIANNKATVHGTDTLAGSIATMDQCVKLFKQFAESTIVEAIDAATLHPALMLGIQDRKGVLKSQADADFVFLNDNLDVKATYIAGSLAWSSAW